MVQLRKLTKREVVVLDIGRDIGRPRDILVDPDTHRVSLIVLAYGKLPETSVVFPAKAVTNFSTDALTIPDLRSLHLALHDEHTLAELKEGIRLRGRVVFSTEGRRLGAIVGIDVDEAGKVTRYSLRHPRLGLFRPTVPLDPAEVSKMGDNVMVAKEKSAVTKPKKPTGAKKAG